MIISFLELTSSFANKVFEAAFLLTPYDVFGQFVLPMTRTERRPHSTYECYCLNRSLLERDVLQQFKYR